MNRNFLLIIIFLGTQSIQWSNPTDNTPITELSELVFDNNDKWTMELLFPFGYWAEVTDSIVIKISNVGSKLKKKYLNGIFVAFITSDNLTIPLSINRQGDTIKIFTYSNIFNNKSVREDRLIFGDCPGAGVGKPINGYSIFRLSDGPAKSTWEVNFLTKNPSLGVLNKSIGQYGILKGSFYDRNGKLISKLGLFGVIGYPYFELETPLKIDSTGAYSTQIFNTIYKAGQIKIKGWDFPGYLTIIEIDSFELKDIHPDTLVIQDIHLKWDCGFCQVLDEVEDYVTPITDEFKLINYPNPFNSSTNFFIKIPSWTKNKSTNINIYNISGQLVRSIPATESSTLKWDGRDMNGGTMSSGIYYYNLIMDKQVMKSGSMILLK
ncbi:MAG: T9SS type A sorting domain-containing protein [Ignavibacteriales bacterium]|nr:T9SS type A sorting domain-containing protein [Ignavibacteriales bacterium]